MRSALREQLRISRGAMILFFITVGVSLVRALSDLPTRATIDHWLATSASAVWSDGRVWTLVTSPILEPNVVSLILQCFLLWAFFPTLENFWGTNRFLRFVALTSVAGTVGGTLAGLGTGRDVAIAGLDSFTYAGIVAYGRLYARQPVRFFGVLPMTGKQLMIGILAFLALFIALNGAWEEGAGFVMAVALALLLTSQRYSPELVWGRWRRARARAHLSSIPPPIEPTTPPGGGRKSSKPRGDNQWLN